MELPLQVGDLLLAQESGLGQGRLELPRPHHRHVVHGERAADQGPVRVDEAQHAPHRNLRLIGQGCADQGDLLAHALHQGGAVASSDVEQFDAGSQQASLDAKLGPGVAIALGVHDENPRGAHRQVIDVGPGVRDPAVVEDAQRLSDHGCQHLTQHPFTLSADRPSSRGLRIVEHREQEPADLRMVGQHPLLVDDVGFMRLARH